MPQSSLAVEAIALARSGFAVFPLRPGDKRPLFPKCKAGRSCKGGCGEPGHGCHDGTRDEELLSRWWEKRPDANVGIRCGRASAVWVLDVDVRHGGESALAKLIREHHGEWPITRAARTRAGGLHYYWAIPPDGPCPKNKVNLQELAGLDVRSEGGYVVAPPSRVPVDPGEPGNGQYQWVSDEPIVEAPAWLLALVLPGPRSKPVPHPARPAPSPTPSSSRTPPPDRVTRRRQAWLDATLRNVAGRLASTPEGGRHNAALSAGLQLGHYVGSGWLSLEAARQCLLDAALATGLDARDASRTIEDGLARTMTEPRTPCPTDAELAEEERQAQGDWTSPPPPPFDDGDEPPPSEAPPPDFEDHHVEVHEQRGPDARAWDALAKRQDRATGRLVPISCVDNVRKLLRLEPRYRDRLRLNVMGDGPEWNRAPFREGAHAAAEQEWMADVYGIRLAPRVVYEAVVAMCEEHPYHPVAEWLASLAWDGVGRLDSLHTRGLRAPDHPHYARYMARFCIAAAARAFQPGCMMRTALILVGRQYIGKSSFFRELFGVDWFGDSPIPIGNKDAFMLLRYCWGYEAAEFESFNRATAESVKQFLSSTHDLYRPPYSRSAVRIARHTVMCGSTNNPQFLYDPSGATRFWPITIPDNAKPDVQWLRQNREQLWAEAAFRFAQGERWHLNEEEEADAQRLADIDEASEEHPWRAAVLYWAAPRARMGFRIDEVLDALSIPRDRQTRAMARDVVNILRSANYAAKTFYNSEQHGVRERRWWSDAPSDVGIGSTHGPPNVVPMKRWNDD